MFGKESAMRVTDPMLNPMLNRLIRTDKIDRGLTDLIVTKAQTTSGQDAIGLADQFLVEVSDGHQIVDSLVLTSNAVGATISYNSWLRALPRAWERDVSSKEEVEEIINQMREKLAFVRQNLNSSPDTWLDDVKQLRKVFRAMYDVFATQCARPMEKVAILER